MSSKRYPEECKIEADHQVTNPCVRRVIHPQHHSNQHSSEALPESETTNIT